LRRALPVLEGERTRLQLHSCLRDRIGGTACPCGAAAAVTLQELLDRPQAPFDFAGCARISTTKH
jgi:hypothetical protein